MSTACSTANTASIVLLYCRVRHFNIRKDFTLLPSQEYYKPYSHYKCNGYDTYLMYTIKQINYSYCCHYHHHHQVSNCVGGWRADTASTVFRGWIKTGLPWRGWGAPELTSWWAPWRGGFCCSSWWGWLFSPSLHSSPDVHSTRAKAWLPCLQNNGWKANV